MSTAYLLKLTDRELALLAYVAGAVAPAAYLARLFYDVLPGHLTRHRALNHVDQDRPAIALSEDTLAYLYTLTDYVESNARVRVVGGPFPGAHVVLVSEREAAAVYYAFGVVIPGTAATRIWLSMPWFRGVHELRHTAYHEPPHHLSDETVDFLLTQDNARDTKPF